MDPPEVVVEVSSWRRTGQPRVLVVVPTLHPSGSSSDLLSLIPGIIHYEERQFAFLLSLADPLCTITLVTTFEPEPCILDYYLRLAARVALGGERPAKRSQEMQRALSSLRSRLSSVFLFPRSELPSVPFAPLIERLWASPAALEKIAAGVAAAPAGCPRGLVCVNATGREASVARRLGLRAIATPPDTLPLGSKSGSKKIFAEAMIPVARGPVDAVRSVGALVRAAADLWFSTGMKRIVVKLDDGFSGEGNAIVDLAPLMGEMQRRGVVGPEAKVPPAMARDEQTERAAEEAVLRCLSAASFQGPDETWASFSAKIPASGAIVEEFLEPLWPQGPAPRSPSVQGLVNWDGSFSVMSTHEQVLAGHLYQGCEFPALEDYREQMASYAEAVGARLGAHGAVGLLSVDFFARPRPPWAGGGWDLAALEINLRPGGTTHPYLALELLLPTGHYEYRTHAFVCQGAEKFYRASDNLPCLPVEAAALVRAAEDDPDAFCPERGTGYVLHLISCAPGGKTGVTCIADSRADADALYHRLESRLLSQRAKL